MDDTSGIFEHNLGSRVLEHVREGMTVYDLNGDKIGTVEEVFMGGASEETLARGSGPMEMDTAAGLRDDTLVEDFAEALAGDEGLPEVVAARLRRHGYIRVDSGLFSDDLFVMSDQIAAVSEDAVKLGVPADALIEED